MPRPFSPFAKRDWSGSVDKSEIMKRTGSDVNQWDHMLQATYKR